MGKDSKIQWTDNTLNFWIGCQEVSPACDFCYAKTQNLRRHWVDGWGPHGERRRTQYWNDARRWNRMARELGVRLKVFSNSLSDFFDKAVDDKPWRGDAWSLIDECRDLDWLILTKRPQNIPNRLPAGWMSGSPLKPWPHVWLGTTVENQEEADRRIPHLLAVPAAKHFLSCEPLLGPIRLDQLTRYGQTRAYIDNALNGFQSNGYGGSYGPRIDWVIPGGETGPNARPPHPDWLRSLRDQCAAAGVPFFLKAWGDWAPLGQFEAKGWERAGSNGTGEMVGRLTGGFEDGCLPLFNGKRFVTRYPWPTTSNTGHDPGPCMVRVGTARSGALLDGREYRERPSS